MCARRLGLAPELSWRSMPQKNKKKEKSLHCSGLSLTAHRRSVCQDDFTSPRCTANRLTAPQHDTSYTMPSRRHEEFLQICNWDSELIWSACCWTISAQAGPRHTQTWLLLLLQACQTAYRFRSSFLTKIEQEKKKKKKSLWAKIDLLF